MKDLKAFLKSHQIRHTDLAFMTGCTIRAVGTWVSGERPVPRAVELLLLALDEGKIDERWLASKLSHHINRSVA
jgi:hypothetical protein